MLCDYSIVVYVSQDRHKWVAVLRRVGIFKEIISGVVVVV